MVVGGSVDGRGARAAARGRPRRPGRRHRRGQPGRRQRRLDAKALPVLKHLVPGWPAIGNDIKKPGGEEHPYPKTPLKALHTFVRQWKPLIADLPSITQPLLIFRSVEDHVVDSSSVPIITSRVSSRDVTERLLEDSYHVATLDNDAPLIFEESAAFVARVAADAPAH